MGVEPIGIGPGPLNPWSHVKEWRCFAIRFRGRTSRHEWTFAEACRMMRAIPIRASMEIIGPDGGVHFTLPPRKPEDKDPNAGN